MEIFIDTANVSAIRKFARIGIVDGVTTNPALIASEGRDFREVIDEICSIIDGPVSAEVISLDAASMIREGRLISKIHPNIVVKIPATPAGLEAVNILSQEGVKTNVTVLYTTNQALLAAKVGATYVSPFIGRLDVTSTSGTELIREISTVFNNYNFTTKILAASMRNCIYVKHAALAGAHVATIPPGVLEQMMLSELTALGIEGFLTEWKTLPEEKRNYFS